MAQEAIPTPNGLPEGISKPLTGINSQDQSGLIAILTAFSLGLILLSIATRIYSRHDFRLYRIDDFAFFAATVFAIVQTSLVFRELKKGLGKAEDLLQPSAVSIIQKLGFVTDLLYLITLFLSKCCVLFLFLSLTPGRAHMRVIWTTIAASTTWIITSIILEAIRCHPKHPWTDDKSSCTNTFARWAVIAVLDALIELVLVGNSIYLVLGLQMPLKSKLIVVGAFSWRIPNIAFTITRLAFLHRPLDPSSSHLWHARVVSTTQLALGYTITATVIPYLKPLMMAYERPVPSRASYYPSSSGTRFKLSNLTSRSSETASAALATVDAEDDGALRESRSPDGKFGRAGVERGKRSALRLGRLRPERTGYEVTASATEAGGRERSEHGSEDSEQMIIRKGVEWSVKYHNDVGASRDRGNSVAETEESRGETLGSEEVTAVRIHV